MNEIATYPSLKDRVVLITGGASGNGESIVEQFASQKSKVAFLDINDELGNELSKKIKNKYDIDSLFVKCDLKNIEPGEHVHSHNMGYSDFKREYIRNNFKNDIIKNEKTEYFKGFKRNNGSSGTRNYIGLISTVNCSATVVKKISD